MGSARLGVGQLSAGPRSRPDWMDAPVSPLSNEQIKALAQAQVADTGWEPNEVYLTKDDSLALMGEIATQALDALNKARLSPSLGAVLTALRERWGNDWRKDYGRMAADFLEREFGTEGQR